MPCAEWYTSVDSRRLSTVELKSKAFLAVDSGACCTATYPESVSARLSASRRDLVPQALRHLSC
eukprot:1178086-Prorocentrum_minimum.AAC.1